MKFSLHSMVAATVSEAERREKLAASDDEAVHNGENTDISDAKSKSPGASNTPPNNPATVPERNDAEQPNTKTSSALALKLASAIEYLNENFMKVAVGEITPPTPSGSPEAKVGPGEGVTATQTNLDAPTPGVQSEAVGQATEKQQAPMKPGTDPASPGQTNTGTAMETTINDPPGGNESWKDKDILKQSAALLEQKLAGVRETASKAVAAMGRHPLRTAAGAGGAGWMAGVGSEHQLAKHYDTETGLPLKKKAEAKVDQVDRVLGIMKKLADVPPEATASEEGVPSLPGPAASQRKMIDSNEAARDYTKRDAKAEPKERMGEVLDEPAQKKSTDAVLQNNLSNTSEAGVKISAAQAVAARALLGKIAEAGCASDASPEAKASAEKVRSLVESKQKEKEGQGMGGGTASPFNTGSSF